MGMTIELVTNLRDYAEIEDKNFLMGYRKSNIVQNLLREAASMIEELSAKVAQQNMEESSQYYNGGWIDVSDVLPNDKDEYLKYFPAIIKGIIDGGTHDGEEILCIGFGKYIDWEKKWEIETPIRIKSYPQKVLAWCRTPEIPQKYRGIENTIDTEPVQYGKWLPVGTGYSYCFECSKCGWKDGYPFNDRHKYCPNCGAKMIKE